MKIFDEQKHRENVENFRKENSKYKLMTNYSHLNNESIVLDLGAYQGRWALDILNIYNCLIHAFEPLPDFAEQARNNLKNYPKAFVHNYGVSNKNSFEEIVLLKDGSTFFAKGPTKKVEVRDIADILKDLNLTKVDLIKLNVENSEYEILERLIELNLIEIFTSFQIQFHREAKDCIERRALIQNHLLDRGYKCDFNHDWIWESWSKIKG